MDDAVSCDRGGRRIDRAGIRALALGRAGIVAGDAGRDRGWIRSCAEAAAGRRIEGAEVRRGCLVLADVHQLAIQDPHLPPYPGAIRPFGSKSASRRWRAELLDEDIFILQ